MGLLQTTLSLLYFPQHAIIFAHVSSSLWVRAWLASLKLKPSTLTLRNPSSQAFISIAIPTVAWPVGPSHNPDKSSPSTEASSGMAIEPKVRPQTDGDDDESEIDDSDEDEDEEENEIVLTLTIQLSHGLTGML